MDARSARKVRKSPACASALLWGFLAVAAAYGVFLLVLGIVLAVGGR